MNWEEPQPPRVGVVTMSTSVLFAPLCLSLAIFVRKADLRNRADAAAICDIRAPTQFVVEDGTTGFMGQKVKFDPETAHARRVEARLGTAIRDNATVLIATDDSAAAVAVVGTADLIPIAAGRGRRSTAPDLPRRLLLRNLWVAESRRRQGIARQLMTAVETETVKQGVSLISLEVDRTNVPAITLYRDLGFEEIEESPNLPKWMQGMLPPLVLGKWLE